jgi:hypothetical protein
LLYYYKSTNTDACARRGSVASPLRYVAIVLVWGLHRYSVYLLY